MSCVAMRIRDVRACSDHINKLSEQMNKVTELTSSQETDTAPRDAHMLDAKRSTDTDEPKDCHVGKIKRALDNTRIRETKIRKNATDATRSQVTRTKPKTDIKIDKMRTHAKRSIDTDEPKN